MSIEDLQKLVGSLFDNLGLETKPRPAEVLPDQQELNGLYHVIAIELMADREIEQMVDHIAPGSVDIPVHRQGGE